MSSKVKIYSASSTQPNDTDLSIWTDVSIAQNEPMINQVFNRNAKKLLDNDLALKQLYDKIFNQTGIKEYSSNAVYNNGDFIWYTYNDKLYLLKCVVNNNAAQPKIQELNGRPIDSVLKNSGWENKNRYLTIFDYGIESFLSSLVSLQVQKHQDDKSKHPFGKVSLDSTNSAYIGNSLLKKDMSNIDDNRSTVFFPQVVQRLDSNAVITTGYMRVYGKDVNASHCVVEYDIVLKLASIDNVDESYIFTVTSGLSANALNISLYSGLTKNSVSFQDNEKYFYNSSSTDIFSPVLPQNDVGQSRIGMVLQHNRNDYVNTYSAQIDFPKPFANRDYMVFSNSVLCQTNGTEIMSGGSYHLAVPSQNDIVVCNKTRDSITLMNIAFPNINRCGEHMYNAAHGGLIANSFHCKVIGMIGA